MAGGAVAEEAQAPLLRLGQATREQIRQLEPEKACGYSGLDLSLLRCELDEGLVESVVGFSNALAGGTLRIAHSDLGSGTSCEQRLFDLRSERQSREAEKAFHVKAKADSGKEKDFAVSAGKRRKAESGVKEAQERLDAIDEELARLEEQKATTQWCRLFTCFEAAASSSLRCLELPDCDLHATGLEQLTHALLEHEQRAEGARISRLVLDGNDLGDIGMGALSLLLRLSSCVEALHLRNVGITDIGVSKVISGLVGNKTLQLLDLRDNGLASLEVTRAAVSGVMRFNKSAHILLD
mmetsp:Transcript_60306/g.155338  ORF Transcript_60306/g.155338 Transcript_60306/m.155338 type:complete len:296 (-) Transcript_60306:49-936(-)